MKRAPFVIGATGAGLGLLLSFHTKPLHLSIASSSSPSGSSPGPGSTSSTRPTTGPSTSPTTGSSTSPSTSPPTSASTRSATGQDVQYQYGDVQLRVTEQGSSITNIQIVSDNATDPRSAQINSQALPLLQQEAMSAQSANIDGVSGATFTSAAYAHALQSALDRLNA
jgi:uncharacterized protein with FMN-binding domain